MRIYLFQGVEYDCWENILMRWADFAEEYLRDWNGFKWISKRHLTFSLFVQMIFLRSHDRWSKRERGNLMRKKRLFIYYILPIAWCSSNISLLQVSFFHSRRKSAIPSRKIFWRCYSLRCSEIHFWIISFRILIEFRYCNTSSSSYNDHSWRTGVW